MPEGRLYRSMLLDFYGELLTPRQRECFDLHFNEDLSLSEIAETCGISRQGAWDNIRRASESLENIEEKTGLIRRFSKTQEGLKTALAGLERLKALAGKGRESDFAAVLAETEDAIRALMRTED